MVSQNGLSLDQIEIGMFATYSQTITITITIADAKPFVGLSGDNNPVHMSDEFESESRFKKKRVYFSTACSVQNNVDISGEAERYIPRQQKVNV